MTPPTNEAERARVDTALAYAKRGWPVFPCAWQGPNRKRPLTPRGYKDATTDPEMITHWWGRWPMAWIGTPTGQRFVVLDIDPRHGGLGSIAELGFPALPETPTAQTASGGFHLYFSPPLHREIRNTQGDAGRGIGAGLDWRGVGGYVVVPAPGTGYTWLVKGPLTSVPAALLPTQSKPSSVEGTPGHCTELSPYGEAALRNATENILNAPNGRQEANLNRECYSIGSLAAAGGVPVELALELLLRAARGMTSFDLARPWTLSELERKVRRSFRNGFATPRPMLADYERAWAVRDREEMQIAKQYEEYCEEIEREIERQAAEESGSD